MFCFVMLTMTICSNQNLDRPEPAPQADRQARPSAYEVWRRSSVRPIAVLQQFAVLFSTTRYLGRSIFKAGKIEERRKNEQFEG